MTRTTKYPLFVFAALAAVALVLAGCSSSPDSRGVSDAATDDPFKIPQKDWPDPLDVPWETLLSIIDDPEDAEGWEGVGVWMGEIIMYGLEGGFDSSEESVTVQVASFLDDPTQVFVGSCDDGHENSDDKTQGSVGGSDPAVWTATFDPDEGEGGNTRVNCGIELADSSLGDPTSAREGGLLPEVNFNWDAHGSGGFDINIQPGLAGKGSDFNSQIHARAYKDNGQGSDGVVILVIQLGNIPHCPSSFCGISYLMPDSDEVTALDDWVSGTNTTPSPQSTASGVTVTQKWPDTMTVGDKADGTITVTNNTSDAIDGQFQIVGEIPVGLSPATFSTADNVKCEGSATFECTVYSNSFAKGDSITLDVNLTPSSAGDYDIDVQPKTADQQYKDQTASVTVSQ